MHVKTASSPSPAVHASAAAPSGAAKGAKNGAPDFNKMLADAKAGAPASAATAPMTPPAASATPVTGASPAPATLSLDTASLAART